MTDAPHAGFTPTGACWICGGRDLSPVARAIFEFSAYALLLVYAFLLPIVFGGWFA